MSELQVENGARKGEGPVANRGEAGTKAWRSGGLESCFWSPRQRWAEGRGAEEQRALLLAWLPGASAS